MDDEEFIAKRARVYDLAKDLPESMKKEYGISADITKAQAVKDIEKLDKNQVYRIIDGLSNKSLARMFKKARGRKAEKSHEADVNSFWEHLTERIGNP